MNPLHSRACFSPPRRALAGGILLACGLLLGGCAVGPDFVRPAAPQVQAYLADRQPDAALAALPAISFSSDQTLPADWWQLFGSDRLNQLVGQGLQQNLALQAAYLNLKQSQDSVSAAYGVFFPQMDIGLAGKRQRSAPLQNGSAQPAGIFNFVSLTSSISYMLDISGGARRALEGLQAVSEYQRDLSRATYLMLSANLVNAAIANAAYQEQAALYRDILADQQQLVAQAGHQYQSGLLAYSSLLVLRNQADLYQVSLAATVQKASQSEHLLASLAGQPVASYQPIPVRMADLHLPTYLPLSLPSELVRQRPDIRMAEAQLHAASASVGVATAALFPSIGLNAEFGIGASNWAGLSGASQRFWSIGPSLDLPLLKASNGWYARKAAIDAFQAAQLNYRQTVLNAFAQVADTLSALQADQQTGLAKADACRLAEQNAGLVSVSYASGVAADADRLAARIQFRLARIDEIQTQALAYQDAVALFVALGGGWWNAALEGGAQ